MSDDSRKFEIKIAADFDPSGVNRAADGLKKVGEEGGKSADKLFEKNTEVKRLLEIVGNTSIPGVGRAFGELAFGPAGAVIAVAEAVEVVKRGIEQLNQSLDALAANSAKAFGGSDYITEYTKAVEDAARSTEEFQEAMKRAAEDSDPVKSRYDAEAAAIQKIVEALKEKLKAQEEDEIAAARTAAKNSGTSSDVESATEDEIRARYENQNGAIASAAARALQNALTRELQERQENQPALDAATAAAQTSPQVATGRTERAGELAAQEAALAKATSDRNTTADDELRARIQINRDLIEDAKKRYGNLDLLGLRKKMEEETDKLERESAEGRIAAAKKRIEDLAPQIVKDDELAAQEKSALDTARNAALENRKRITDLNKQIAAGNQSQQISASSPSELINELTAGMPTRDFESAAGINTNAGAAAFVKRFLKSQSRLQQHHGTESDQQTIALMNSLLQQTRQTDGRVFLLLQDLIRAKGDQDRALAELSRQIRNNARPQQ